MKTGKSIQELAVELDRQSKTKRDFIASASSLEIISADTDYRPLLNVNNEHAWEMTENFHQQLGGELEIPKKYYDKMLTEAPYLLRQNANHWLKKNNSRRMVRTLDGKARAFLSDKYRPLDNYELAEVALPVLSGTGCRIESCEITESRMYLKAVTERITFDIKPGDTVQAGIVISNSEIGRGSLKIEPLLFRLICTNGMIANDSKLTKYHVGRGGRFDFEGAAEFYRDETRLADDKAFWMKVKDTLTHAFSQIDFERMVVRFRDAQNDKIEAEPNKVIEVTARKFTLSDNESTSVLAHLMAGGEMTRFGLANAITRAAQDIKSYDRATEFERLGGEIIELPRSSWESIAMAA